MGAASATGKSIAVAAAALGVVLGMTAGTVAAGIGAGAITAVSVALIGGSTLVIAISAAASKRIAKAEAR
ncbi:hypothetical protein [Cohnella soli]|uniref:Uncharacterized protein n=1 Tax=Cohnella soli TaxID=425005 RepID=A0ABW0HTM4_9BACL